MMEREIKFRAWIEKLNLSGSEINQMCDVIELRNDGSIKICAYDELNDCETQKFLIKDCCDENFKIMQFTGAHDKRGKEIYEGDILKEQPNGYIGKVLWDWDGYLSVEWNSDYDMEYPDWLWSAMICDHSDRIEVIGNIYENPELLDGK